MRSSLVASILTAAAFGVSAQRYALDEFDLSALALVGSDAGTVEAVRETPVTRQLNAFGPDVIEHGVHPETLEELVIRLDRGVVITVARDPTLRLQPGQRVRVTLPTDGPPADAPGSYGVR